MNHIKNFVLILCLLLFTIYACNNDSGLDPNGKEGTIMVRITDAPFPIDMVDSAIVMITKIEIRSTSSDTGNPFVLLSDDTTNVNLIELQNGVIQLLVETDVPVGTYDLVRLYVDEANIYVKDNLTPFSMKVPSGSQTGIKMFVNPEIEVVSGISADLLLDFDLSRSFAVKGNPNTPAEINGFNFKPVIRAINNTSAGTIAGVVADTSSTLLEEAAVWAEQDTGIVSTTFTDENGSYAMVGLLAGNYTVSATKADYDTVSVDVQIIAGNQTDQDFELTPKQ
jgi:hypothetical protein